jgi:hypothetical protein
MRRDRGYTELHGGIHRETQRKNLNIFVAKPFSVSLCASLCPNLMV